MTKPTVLLVSNRDTNCGVHQFGSNVARVLERSSAFDFRYVECATESELQGELRRAQPVAVLYNFHKSTLPWLTIPVCKRIDLPQLGVLHEVTQQVADAADGTRFDFHVAPDPTLLLRNPRVYKTGRFVPAWKGTAPDPVTPTIGSFGFATGGKGFERLVDQVQRDFDRAHVRLHIPFARFGDESGANARRIAAACRARLTKSGITLEVTHEFWSDEQLLGFLASNSLNAFLYDDAHGRGISSVTDYALAVRRPLAVSGSSMFRHLHQATPSIIVAPDNSLSAILAHGSAPLAPFTREWTHANLTWDYERIVKAALARWRSPRDRAHLLGRSRTVRTATALSEAAARRSLDLGIKATRLVSQRIATGVSRRLARLGLGSADSADWVPRSSTSDTTPRHASLPPYRPALETRVSYNRVLDDDARAFYAEAIAYLGRAAPDVIARKIARANVQQAFVLDAVTRFAGPPGAARLLCVGSYEDTAAISLMRGGYAVDEVDPVLNYDLTTFATKPSSAPESWDVIFSTSVIEHVADDEEFVRSIAHLLKPGGVAILTCDFRSGFRPGDRMPREDRRLYTVDDLQRRLLAHMPGCELADPPSWNSHREPDFEYRGTMYSFAAFVVRKRTDTFVS